MGIITCRARFFLEAKKKGVDFSSTLTLGRQMCNMTARELLCLRKIYEIPELSGEREPLSYRSYADPFFFRYLDVKKLHVMDYSDYQGADIIHDLNYPVEKGHEESFDVVVDGGTMEHIFNLPVAILNCMRMVKTGGSLFIFSMANNHCGHGFYQFSPELFFRLFQREYGFKIDDVILVKHPFPSAELSEKQECFRVKDPAEIGRRSVIVTKSPVGIMVHAVKIAHKSQFPHYPQQSDYMKTWQSGGVESCQKRRKIRSFSLSKRGLISLMKYFWVYLPFRPKLYIAGLYQIWAFSLKRDKAFYSRWP